jgi:two-component system sensor histidine kinase QseC
MLRSGHLKQKPDEIKKYFTGSKTKSKDEFYTLVRSMENLLNTVDKTQRQTKIWTYQVAHELKTPLSILGVEIDKAKRGAPLDLKQLKSELIAISDTINSFLDWAEFENSNLQRRMHAIWVSEEIRSVINRIDPSSGRRIELKSDDDFCIVCNPHHFQQAISNLITNALKYSPNNTPVEVTIHSTQITVKDTGPGIQQEVLARFGEPFNRGANSNKGLSHGLGLAWVNSVAKIYDWAVEFNSSKLGTTVGIDFHQAVVEE